MKKIKRLQEQCFVPRYIIIIIIKLGIRFQPNLGSSFYKLPRKEKILKGQEYWDSPFGTLRLSDHWNYVNKNEKLVYVTDVKIPKYTWCLAINTGIQPSPWKVLNVFSIINNENVINNIDYKKIHKNIFQILQMGEAAQ